MNPDVWKLHAAVFELARACKIGRFRVDTMTHPGGAVVELVLEEAQRASFVPAKAAPPPSPAYAVAPR
jgi:hypothetical protein